MGIDPKTAAEFAELVTHANWNSAFRSMDFWAGRQYPKEVPPGMVQLANEVRYFSHKYVSFLSKVTLEPAETDEFDQTKLRNQALERVLEEWDTIRHALEQRENPRYQKTLVELDELTVECLSPLFGEKSIRGKAFAYFHKLFDIKRFAFSRIPLIGAPFSALNSPEDWLAIPHEAGHYIFWNGTSTFTSFNQFYLALQDRFVEAISNSLQNRITGRVFHHKGEVYQVWLNWLNEIFADVFGTLVAGPAFAWSMQSNLRAGLSVRDLLHYHGEPDHPDPFIRPYFHINTLREMAKEKEIDLEFANQLNATANLLEKSWKDSWPGNITIKLPTPDSIGSMEDVLKNEVPAVVSVILDANLGENLPFSLREYFRKGSLYNFGLHKEVLGFAEQIQNGELDIESPLKKGITAQLAIVNGMDPIDVHVALGYAGAEELPVPDEALDQQFAEFIESVTGQKELEKQREAWRRVLNYSLKEQDFHTHNHPHVDGSLCSRATTVSQVYTSKQRSYRSPFSKSVRMSFHSCLPVNRPDQELYPEIH